MVRVVSRCATGCREPHTYSADASPSSHAPSAPRRTFPPSRHCPSLDLRAPAPVIYCPDVPKDPRHAGRGRNFPRPLAKLELRSSFRDRLMFRHFIKTEKRRGSRPGAVDACLRYALPFNRQASEPHICSSLSLSLSHTHTHFFFSGVLDLCLQKIDTNASINSLLQSAKVKSTSHPQRLFNPIFKKSYLSLTEKFFSRFLISRIRIYIINNS